MHPKCNSKRDRLMTDPNYLARYRKNSHVSAERRARIEFIMQQASEAYKNAVSGYRHG